MEGECCALMHGPGMQARLRRLWSGVRRWKLFQGVKVWLEGSLVSSCGYVLGFGSDSAGKNYKCDFQRARTITPPCAS